MQNFIDRLRLAIRLSGKKQSDIAAECGFNPSYLSLVVTGKSKMKSDPTKKRLAEITGVDPDWLINGNEEKAPLNTVKQAQVLQEEPVIYSSGNTKEKAMLQEFFVMISKMIPIMPIEALDELKEKVKENPVMFAPIIPELLDEYDKRFRK